jgi:RimJ/RimL family protein N-acetyltransferase
MAYHYSSPRLEFRAIRPTSDIPLFTALGADLNGYINSSFSNIHLPTETDTTDFIKYLLEKCLLGAVVWLKHPSHLTTAERKELVATAKNEGREHIVEEYGTAIGEIHLSRLEPQHMQHRSTEIGVDVLPEYQGKGYGSEAINWALEYAFHRAGLHRVKIGAFEWNKGAVRLYEKLGFKLEGRAREACWHEGKFWDMVEFGMLEGEWRASVEKGNEVGKVEEKA